MSSRPQINEIIVIKKKLKTCALHPKFFTVLRMFALLHTVSYQM